MENDTTVPELIPEPIQLQESPAKPPKRIPKNQQIPGVVGIENMTIRERKFMKAFLEADGNATEAAVRAFKLQNRDSATTIGYRYLNRIKPYLARFYLEDKGANFGKLLEILFEKAKESKSPEFLDRLFKIGGYYDFMDKKVSSGPGVVNIISTQKKLNSEYVEGEVEEITQE